MSLRALAWINLDGITVKKSSRSLAAPACPRINPKAEIRRRPAAPSCRAVLSRRSQAKAEASERRRVARSHLTAVSFLPALGLGVQVQTYFSVELR
jgi:hypothetical protein